MNKPKAEIGKFSIESLTTGMYENHLVVYREYVQNSADSLDKAVQDGIITQQQAIIDIIINKEERRIEILDNGLGIPGDVAFKTLVDVGKSTKDYSTNRGFRGIGRLAGFAYCNTLKFVTSFKGEPFKSIVTFDCSLMKKLLIPGESDHLTAENVLDLVTSYEKIPEDSAVHYFSVIMEGIDANEDKLLDMTKVNTYLSQVAPVPFNRGKFVFTTEIINLFEKYDVPLTEYKISIGDSKETLKPIYKPYKHRYALFNKKNAEEVLQIEPIIKESDGKLLYIGWYGKTNLQGACSEEHIKGIRLRKGNIMVGDSNTLSELFREERFNSWYIGEIHILDPEIIPNARRDNFELNNAYYQIRSYLTDFFDRLSLDIREASKKRNEGEGKLIKLVQEAEDRVTALIKNGASSKVEKKKVMDLLIKANESSDKIKATTEEGKEKIKDYKMKIKNLEQILENKVQYKGRDLPSSYSKKEKKIVQIIFEVIDNNLESTIAENLINKILQELKK